MRKRGKKNFENYNSLWLKGEATEYLQNGQHLKEHASLRNTSIRDENDTIFAPRFRVCGIGPNEMRKITV